MILLELFWTFFKIGLFTFGGGYAMLPLIQSEVIGAGWISETDLINFVAVSESTPGPFAVNISTYVGMETAGFFGAICATLGVVLPSFLIILTVAKCYEKFSKNHLVVGAMGGLKPAVVGLIGATIISVGRTTFGAETEIIGLCISAGIFILSLVLVFKKKHPVLIIGLSAIIGAITGLIIGGG
ncbi:MAG: chromate transporter [Lachnospiraceae bacterium]